MVAIRLATLCGVRGGNVWRSMFKWLFPCCSLHYNLDSCTGSWIACRGSCCWSYTFPSVCWAHSIQYLVSYVCWYFQHLHVCTQLYTTPPHPPHPPPPSWYSWYSLTLVWLPLVLIILKVMCKFVFLESDSTGKFLAITNRCIYTSKYSYICIWRKWNTCSSYNNYTCMTIRLLIRESV